MIIQCYSDPGHSWFKVKKALLIKLNIADDISHYSYARNDSVYLEEDCDAKKLFKALDNANIKWSYRENNTNKTSKIRSYNRYKKGL
jgi:hypothetical protein